ncbi:MAG: hypothetical protein KKA54_07505 [Proteobacteria bacterium]|nr:hypothetical protein [Pseudomonadota bacterium]MBU0966210.1 hypothetical protein [Pseudomonadota bacterium]
MKAINATLSNSGQISRTTQYERSSQVQVSRQVMREQGSETEIAKKTTTQKTIETTRTRRELETKIRELNKKLDELGRPETQFKISSTGDESTVRLVDSQTNQSFDLKGTVEDLLAADATTQGLLVDTVT